MPDRPEPEVETYGTQKTDGSGDFDKTSDQGPQERRAPTRLSDLLRGLTADEGRERLALSDMIDAVSVRAFGPLLLIFALPNMIPAPPGASAILGLPLIILTFQMMMGNKPRFPAFLAQRSLRRDDFGRMLDSALPHLRTAERMLRPRLGVLSSRLGERVLGVLCFSMAAIVVLPIPLGNMAPSFAISLIGLGLIERDGYWILGGISVATASFILVYGVIWTMLEAGISLLPAWFS